MHWNSTLFTSPRAYQFLSPRLEQKYAASPSTTFAAMSVVELPDRWTVEIDLPGVSLDDINVVLNDGLLVIEGERRSRVTEGARELFNDRQGQKFRRELRVGEGVDQDRIDAELRDGVLTLQLFRSAEPAQQKITIRNANL